MKGYIMSNHSEKLLLAACKGALAALSQNKTYPADIKAAKMWLKHAIDRNQDLNIINDSTRHCTITTINTKGRTYR
jgi:hypothetical protein